MHRAVAPAFVLAAALLPRRGDDRRAQISAAREGPEEPEVPSPEAVAEEAGEPGIPSGPARPIEGVVVDDEGHPVAGARLAGRPRDGEPGDARAAFCDGWGRSRLEGAARGPRVLEVRGRAGSGWAGRAAESVAPAAGARIRVVRPTLPRYTVDADAPGGLQANVVSDGRIVGSFPRRLGGAVEVILTRPGRFSLLVDTGDAVAGPVEFDAEPGGIVDLGHLQLSTGSPAAVAVTDRAGRAARQVEVAVLSALPSSPEPLRLTRITGDGGVAAFDLPPGGFRVEVRSGKFGPAEASISLAEGESRQLELAVDPR